MAEEKARRCKGISGNLKTKLPAKVAALTLQSGRDSSALRSLDSTVSQKCAGPNPTPGTGNVHPKHEEDNGREARRARTNTKARIGHSSSRKIKDIQLLSNGQMSAIHPRGGTARKSISYFQWRFPFSL